MSIAESRSTANAPSSTNAAAKQTSVVLCSCWWLPRWRAAGGCISTAYGGEIAGVETASDQATTCGRGCARVSSGSRGDLAEMLPEQLHGGSVYALAAGGGEGLQNGWPGAGEGGQPAGHQVGLH